MRTGRFDLSCHPALAGRTRCRMALHRALKNLNGYFRDECLNEHVFRGLPTARRIIEAWRLDYNHASQHPSVYTLEEKRFC